jgi:vanillate O-demethylase monooxygenase subunit
MWNLNAITPETERTSHYFWGQAHNFDVGNARTTAMIIEQIRTAFLEDVAVFEALERLHQEEEKAAAAGKMVAAE